MIVRSMALWWLSLVILVAADRVPRAHRIELEDCAWRVAIPATGRVVWVRGDSRSDAVLGELPANAGRIGDDEIFWNQRSHPILDYREEGDGFTVRFDRGTLALREDGSRQWLVEFTGSDGATQVFRTNADEWSPDPGTALVRRDDATALLKPAESGGTTVRVVSPGHVTVINQAPPADGKPVTRTIRTQAAYPVGPGSERVPIANPPPAPVRPTPPIETPPLPPAPVEPPPAASGTVTPAPTIPPVRQRTIR